MPKSGNRPGLTPSAIRWGRLSYWFGAAALSLALLVLATYTVLPLLVGKAAIEAANDLGIVFRFESVEVDLPSSTAKFSNVTLALGERTPLEAKRMVVSAGPGIFLHGSQAVNRIALRDGSIELPANGEHSATSEITSFLAYPSALRLERFNLRNAQRELPIILDALTMARAANNPLSRPLRAHLSTARARASFHGRAMPLEADGLKVDGMLRATEMPAPDLVPLLTGRGVDALGEISAEGPVVATVNMGDETSVRWEARAELAITVPDLSLDLIGAGQLRGAFNAEGVFKASYHGTLDNPLRVNFDGGAQGVELSFAASKNPPPTTAGRLQAIAWEGRMQIFPRIRLDGRLRVPYGEIRFSGSPADALSVVGLDMEARGEPGASQGLGIAKAHIEELNLSAIGNYPWQLAAQSVATGPMFVGWHGDIALERLSASTFELRRPRSVTRGQNAMFLEVDRRAGRMLKIGRFKLEHLDVEHGAARAAIARINGAALSIGQSLNIAAVDGHTLTATAPRWGQLEGDSVSVVGLGSDPARIDQLRLETVRIAPSGSSAMGNKLGLPSVDLEALTLDDAPTAAQARSLETYSAKGRVDERVFRFIAERRTGPLETVIFGLTVDGWPKSMDHLINTLVDPGIEPGDGCVSLELTRGNTTHYRDNVSRIRLAARDIQPHPMRRTETRLDTRRKWLADAIAEQPSHLMLDLDLERRDEQPQLRDSSTNKAPRTLASDIVWPTGIHGFDDCLLRLLYTSR